MIVTNMERQPRMFGPSKGVPMLHLEVEEGKGKLEDLVESTLRNMGGLKQVFVGHRVVQGLSSFLEALSKMGLELEIQIVGDVRTPGWLNGPDLVLVDYRSNLEFNYYSLRKKDFILCDVKTREDLDKFREFFEEHTLTPASKWLVLPKDLLFEGFSIASIHPRCRVSVREEENYVDYTANNKEEVQTV